MLPHAPSADNNKGPIGDILVDAFAGAAHVLEIGSGTGQQAVHLAGRLPHVSWQPSDLADALPGLAARVADEGPENLRPPIELDVAWKEWPSDDFDAVFSANSVHIMSWAHVEALFAGLGRAWADVTPGRRLALYGPYKYGGEFTTPSNAQFDRWLRDRDPVSGIRDFEAVDALARDIGLTLIADHNMPANNQLLVWSG